MLADLKRSLGTLQPRPPGKKLDIDRLRAPPPASKVRVGVFLLFYLITGLRLMGACGVSWCGHVQAGSEWSFHVPTTLLSDAERMVFGGLSAVMAQVRPLQALLFVFSRLFTAFLYFSHCITVLRATHRNRQSPPAKRRYGPSTSTRCCPDLAFSRGLVGVPCASGAAVALGQPAKYKGFVNGFRVIVVEEGVLGGLYKVPHNVYIPLSLHTEHFSSYPRSQGMAPSIGRELCYSTLRFGLYSPIKV
jgi:hypothetical protein